MLLVFNASDCPLAASAPSRAGSTVPVLGRAVHPLAQTVRHAILAAGLLLRNALAEIVDGGGHVTRDACGQISAQYHKDGAKNVTGETCFDIQKPPWRIRDPKK